MILLAIIIVGMLIPAGFSTSEDQVVITYGETTHANADYKNAVDTFFKNHAYNSCARPATNVFVEGPEKSNHFVVKVKYKAIKAYCLALLQYHTICIFASFFCFLFEKKRRVAPPLF